MNQFMLRYKPRHIKFKNMQIFQITIITTCTTLSLSMLKMAKFIHVFVQCVVFQHCAEVERDEMCEN